MNLKNLAGARVFHDAFARDVIGVLEAHLASRGQTEEFPRRVLHEILAFDVKFPRKRYLPRASIRVFRVIFRFQPFHLSIGIVVNNHLDWIQHCHDAGGALVQICPDRILQLTHFNEIIRF